MPLGRPHTFALTLSSLERAQLTEWAASRSLPHALVQRAQAILLSADGLANTEVGARVGLSHPMVGHSSPVTMFLSVPSAAFRQPRTPLLPATASKLRGAR
jgi:hypothetical protein